MSDAPDVPSDAPPLTEITCEELPPVASGTCEITPGDETKLIRGEVLTPTMLFHGGGVAINPAGQITCVGCDCAAAGQTVITCPDASISPGLINTHDHTQFSNSHPAGDPFYTNDVSKRYEDRQQWREGDGANYPKVRKSGTASNDQIKWGELRFLMSGVTSIVGEGAQAGLLRNLDKSDPLQEGLGQTRVEFDTFPLDDFDHGLKRTADCDYGGNPTTAASLAAFDAYEPHISEGINATAHNEFLCQSSTTYDTTPPGLSNDLVLDKTAVIHAVGLRASEYGQMATKGSALIWSPRSNISLYGDTARVTIAKAFGIEIALGTDWMPSGSMNMLRELACADSFNRDYLNGAFSDTELWKMVTSNAAAVTATDDVIGVLSPGHQADISIFRRNGKPAYRAVLEAEAADVALVMRGGKVLYGDAATVAGLTLAACDTVDVCGTSKKVCLMAEVGKTYAQLETAAQQPAGTAPYPAFTCGAPMYEPSCVPQRPRSVAGSTIYTGDRTATDADGDGIPDAQDKCPMVFDPIRPMDDGQQGDADNDGLGDACDPCPLDANSTACTSIDPNDRDHDGTPNADDNCPDIANPDQADADNDGKGDVCDACPDQPNPGSAGCAVSIYSIKNGTTPVGAAVRVNNALVTGKGSNGFFIQVKEGDPAYTGPDYSGLFVFTTSTSLLGAANVGATVSVEGKIAAYQGALELDSVSVVTQTAAGPETPTPVAVTYDEVKTGGTRAAKLESVVVSLGAAKVTALDAMYGEATLTASGGTTTLVLDDYLYVPSPPLTVNLQLGAVRGVLAMRQSASKLEPRNAADITRGAPGLSALTPALSYARVGATTDAPTFPTPLRVTMSGPVTMDTVVTVTSSTPTALTVSNVTVPAGQSFVDVPVTAVAQAADVTVTAMLGTAMQMAHVRVLAADEAPATATLSPAMAAVAPSSTVELAVTLDVPALVATQVALSVTPSTAGTVPPTVTVPAGQLTATFTYTDTSAMDATVTATFNAGTSTAAVTVSTGANHLVINEVDYDQPAGDSGEYIEIYNPSASAVSLAGKQIVLINGASGGAAVYKTIDLGTGSLAAGGYLVIASSTVSVPAGVTKIVFSASADNIQNGSPDGIALIDNTAHTLIDALAYEGPMPAVALPGFSAPVPLVEGTVLPTAVADSNDDVGALCRSPNGQDTDDAATDWKFCTTLSPGAANP